MMTVLLTQMAVLLTVLEHSRAFNPFFLVRPGELLPKLTLFDQRGSEAVRASVCPFFFFFITLEPRGE